MTQRMLKVSKVKYNDAFVPKIRLSGLWLNKIGFTSGKQVEIDYSIGCLKLNLLHSNNSSNSDKICKLLVSTSSGGKNRIVPEIKFYGLWIEEIGFKIEDKVMVVSDYGVINISLLKL